MQKFINAEASQHEMRLIQLGAKIDQVHSKLCFVQFDLDGFLIEYAYNINRKGQYFLERIKPYPLPVKTFDDQADMVEIIRIDVEQFKTAKRSKNIDAFLTINKALLEVAHRFEDLFLYYNVPSIETKIIMDKIREIEAEIDQVKGSSQRLFFEKDPDNL